MNTATRLIIISGTLMNAPLRNKNIEYEYIADSKWSNIKFLAGIIAIIIIPPLIPGVTSDGLIMSYAGVVICIYI